MLAMLNYGQTGHVILVVLWLPPLIFQTGEYVDPVGEYRPGHHLAALAAEQPPILGDPEAAKVPPKDARPRPRAAGPLVVSDPVAVLTR
ncbi:hypothetical protein [Micromonospora sp. DT47]|uniref:hypothetical protein n=1 Tax=Micromonospora sp. DT47 TaxID=3393431 RepID=UPI003CF367C4